VCKHQAFGTSGAVELECRILGYVVEVGPEALVAAVLITEGGQFLIVQNQDRDSGLGLRGSIALPRLSCDCGSATLSLPKTGRGL